jgi:hypothetical protein
MNCFKRFKGLVVVALAFCVTAQGSSFINGDDVAKDRADGQSKEYNISVSSGQAQQSQSAATLSISGDNSKVSVGKEGTMKLVAGKSIKLLPGTKVTNGGFLYASIESKVKAGKHTKKEVSIVTIEENKRIEEQASLATACSLFSPFPSGKQGRLNAGDEKNGSFISSNSVIYGVTPEQQRKVAVEGFSLLQVKRNSVLLNSTRAEVSVSYRPEAHTVLRL